MFLVDSSVWIVVLDHGHSLPAYTPDLHQLAICPPIIQEVLQGARDERRHDLLLATLLEATLLDESVPLARFQMAARISRACRQHGYTIRSSVDCLIAACALAYGAELLHNDRDFERIAEVTGLRARRVTPSPA